MAELSVEISAKIDRLQKELAKAKGEFKGLESAANKTNTKLGKSTDRVAKGMKNLRGQTINGNSAMTAFSRTIQDAPFGIMGVSNNITNLTEQFGYLKNKTGSAGGALKAMIRDMKGFGGITLLISIATSLLLVFGDKIFATKNKVKVLREEQDKANKTLEDYIFQLGQVDKAQLKGSQSAQKEIVTLGFLKAQIEDTTLSTNKRKGAIEELRKKYPDYLKNMSDEKILNGGLASTYDVLTTSILKRAKVTASMSLIVENTKKLLTIESQLADNKAKNSSLDSKAKALENTALLLIQKGLKGAEGATGKATSSRSKYNDSVKVGSDLIKQQKKLIEDNLKLETNITATGGIADPFIPGDSKTREKVTASFERIYQTYNTGIDGFQDLVLNNQVDFSSLGMDLQDRTIDWEAYFANKKLEEQSEITRLNLEKFNNDSKNLIDNSLVSTFSGIGNAIGGALENGGNVLSAVGSSLLQSMGQYLSKMGGLMISYGKLAVVKGKLDVAIAIGGPVAIVAGAAAIKTGIALVIAGAAISAAAGSLGGGGQGGGSNRGVSNDTGSYSPSGGSSSSSNGNGGGFQNVVFEIQGTKLVGVLSNTLARNRSLGGSLSLT